jgi:hypothetical protein
MKKNKTYELFRIDRLAEIQLLQLLSIQYATYTKLNLIDDRLAPSPAWCNTCGGSDAVWAGVPPIQLHQDNLRVVASAHIRGGLGWGRDLSG